MELKFGALLSASTRSVGREVLQFDIQLHFHRCIVFVCSTDACDTMKKQGSILHLTKYVYQLSCLPARRARNAIRHLDVFGITGEMGSMEKCFTAPPSRLS
jgi:hypothetical protein